MPDLNHFSITGIISRAASPAATNTGHQYAKFSVEVDRAYALRDGTLKPRKCFFQCTVFGRLTDQAARELLHGVRVALEGEVAEQRTRNQATQEWESLFCLEVQRWVLLSAAPASVTFPAPAPAPAPAAPAPEYKPIFRPPANMPPVPDEDLPF
jgi:single-stranded DNA-binding protein